MIKRLLIKDSPSFDILELDLEGGFNVISGASGAGKSVLLHSLLSAFGIKECNAGLVELEIAPSVFNGSEFEDDFGIIKITKKDKTRYFINHQSVSKKILANLLMPSVKSISLKDADELESRFLVRLLDSFVTLDSHKDLLAEYSANFLELKEEQKKLLELKEEQKNILQLKEFATFEVDKISSVNPKEGEYERLLDLKKNLSKKEKIQESLKEANNALCGLDRIGSFLNLVEHPRGSFDDFVLELSSIISHQEQKMDDLQELDTEEILDRISLLHGLINKYGSVDLALQRLEEQKQKLLEYENIEFDISSLSQRVVNLEKKCILLSEEIHKNRLDALKPLSVSLNSICERLKLVNPSLVLDTMEMDERGSSRASIFLGNSNLNTLSAGEYNRLRLAVMMLDANPSGGVLILDEIDANLSGSESEGVAMILSELSKKYQIFAISHQPHMPLLATSHYLVEKSDSKSSVSKLDFDGRVNEIARMISGEKITKEALDFAKTRLTQSLKQ